MIPAIASASLAIDVIWSLVARLRVFSNIGNVVSRDSWQIMCCSCVGSRWFGTCPEKNAGVCWGGFCPVTVLWVCVCRSMFFRWPANHLPLRWFYNESRWSYSNLCVSLVCLKPSFVGLQCYPKNPSDQVPIHYRQHSILKTNWFISWPIQLWETLISLLQSLPSLQL